MYAGIASIFALVSALFESHALMFVTEATVRVRLISAHFGVTRSGPVLGLDWIDLT